MIKKNLIKVNPYSPRLYALIKLHKDGHPIRPIVSYFSVPASKISKAFLCILIQYTKFIFIYSINKSIVLVIKTQKKCYSTFF